MAVEKNAAAVLPVRRAHLCAFRTFNHQDKTLRLDDAIVSRSQYFDGHMGNCQLPERFLVVIHQLCGGGDLFGNFPFRMKCNPLKK